MSSRSSRFLAHLGLAAIASSIQVSDIRVLSGKWSVGYISGGVPLAQAKLSQDDQNIFNRGLEFIKAESNPERQVQVALEIATQDLDKLKWDGAGRDIAGGAIVSAIESVLRSEPATDSDKSRREENLNNLIRAAKKLGHSARYLVPILADQNDKIPSGTKNLADEAVLVIVKDTNKALQLVGEEGIGDAADGLEAKVVFDETRAMEKLLAETPEGEDRVGGVPLPVDPSTGVRSVNRIPAGIGQRPLEVPTGDSKRKAE